jgi:TonB family protein
MADHAFWAARDRVLLAVALATSVGLFCTESDAQIKAAHLDSAFQNYQPRYPDAAQANGEQGNVVLDVYVGDDGNVRKIRINQSSGFDDLDNAAIAGVLSWRFVPANYYGDVVSDWTTVTIVYQLPRAVVLPPAPPH